MEIFRRLEAQKAGRRSPTALLYNDSHNKIINTQESTQVRPHTIVKRTSQNNLPPQVGRVQTVERFEGWPDEPHGPVEDFFRIPASILGHLFAFASVCLRPAPKTTQPYCRNPDTLVFCPGALASCSGARSVRLLYLLINTAPTATLMYKTPHQLHRPTTTVSALA